MRVARGQRKHGEATIHPRLGALSMALVFVLSTTVSYLILPIHRASALPCTTEAIESVLGYDKDHVDATWGSKGGVTLPAFGTYYHGAVRSVIDVHTYGLDFAEAGWSRGPDFSPSSSEFFANVYAGGQIVGSVYNGISLSASTAYTFKIHDAGNDGYWHGAVLNSSGTTLDSTTLSQVSWKHGTALTDTEIHSECDPRNSHWTSLNDCTTACTWVLWTNARCYQDNIPDRDFDRISASEHKVDAQTPDTSCSPP